MVAYGSFSLVNWARRVRCCAINNITLLMDIFRNESSTVKWIVNSNSYPNPLRGLNCCVNAIIGGCFRCLNLIWNEVWLIYFGNLIEPNFIHPFSSFVSHSQDMSPKHFGIQLKFPIQTQWISMKCKFRSITSAYYLLKVYYKWASHRFKCIDSISVGNMATMRMNHSYFLTNSYSNRSSRSGRRERGSRSGRTTR